MTDRWWVYQRERFPLAAHGPLIFAFSLSAMSYSALLRGETRLQPVAIVVAFITALLFFLQLRIADEFKDAEDDARWRPYRPVPRGLVSLGELARVGVGAAAIQLAGSLLVDPRLVLWLFFAWSYLALMSREFFIHGWLRRHPVFYMLSHMVILPVFDIYATACEWLPAGSALHSGLGWFLAASYLNGIVIETGRKIRQPADEEAGVETYTALWGAGRALVFWLSAMFLTAICAWRGSLLTGFTLPMVLLLAPLLLWAASTARNFYRQPESVGGKRIELISGVWTLVMYLSLGALPLFGRNLESIL